MSHTAALLDFASAPHMLPPPVRNDALRLLADTLAVMAAGAASTETQRVIESGAGEAFANGFAIHCLEWDAVHEGAVVHAMSVVTAALLAVSKQTPAHDPEAFLKALSIGVDIACGLGIAATGPMQFFRPAMAGVIGAALAVAHLAGLSRAQMADVLGLAYSFAGGTMQAHLEGSIALPLQIGRAAQAAVQSVDLVKAGFTGPHHVLEGPFGYSNLIEPLDLARYTATLGHIWRISEISIKPYPSGRASHGVLAALSDIRESARAAKAITAYVPPLIHRLVGRPMTDDMTPAYARLCLPFLAALMLRNGRIDPRRFTSETFADPLIAELAALVTVTIDSNPDGNAMVPQRLVIDYVDGSQDDIAISATLGNPDAPMTPAQAAQKYDLCSVLAGDCDTRIFDDPLGYIMDPK